MNVSQYVKDRIEKLEEESREKDKIYQELCEKTNREFLTYAEEGKYRAISYQLHGIAYAISELYNLQKKIEQEESYKCGSCSERVVDYCSYLNKYLYIIDNEEYYRCVECIDGNYKMNEDGCFIEDELT